MEPPPNQGSSELRPRRLSSIGSQHSHADHVEYIQPLREEPPSRSISHTPPLPPTASQVGSRPTFDPLEDFSQESSNLEATERCLAAACSLLQFQIAEVHGDTFSVVAVLVKSGRLRDRRCSSSCVQVTG